MKKLLMITGRGLLAAGSLYAACFGPFCWDDTGAYVAGVAQNGNGVGTPSSTAANIKTLTPTAAGQVIFCSDCLGGGSKGTVCVSTGTSKYAYSLSSGTACL